MADAEAVFEIDAWLVCEGHAGLEEDLSVPLVEIRRLMGYGASVVVDVVDRQKHEGETDL